MENIAWYVYVLFSATVILSIWLFIKSTNYSRTPLIIIGAWVLLQAVLGLTSFYSDSAKLTTRFPLLVVPPVIFLTSLFFTKNGKAFIDKLDLKVLTIFHIIRIPVEITLLFLFLGRTIPEAMTFEGRNFDILSGISVPIIYYLFFNKKLIGKTVVILWNIGCMLLLFSVVTTAGLSLPDRYQNFNFEQVNIAVGVFSVFALTRSFSTTCFVFKCCCNQKAVY